VREFDNLTNLRVPNVTKSGSLNLLEPSGSHRACYGTDCFTPLCDRLLSVNQFLPRVYVDIRPVQWRTQDFFRGGIHYAYVTSCLGEKKKYRCGGDSWRGGLFVKQLKK
jgi:hypothetical protein